MGARGAVSGAGIGAQTIASILRLQKSGRRLADLTCAQAWHEGGAHVLEPVEVAGLRACTRVRSSLQERAARPASRAAHEATTGAHFGNGAAPSAAVAAGAGSEVSAGAPAGGLSAPAASVRVAALASGGVAAEPGGAVGEYRLVDGVMERNLVDSVLVDHEARWQALDAADASYASAVRYLLRRINVERDLSPILDPDELRKLAYTIYRYRNRIDEPDAQDLRYFAEQTGVAGSSSERWRSSNRSKWTK